MKGLVSVLCLLACGWLYAAPQVTAVKLDTPPTLDGKLTDPCWQVPPPIKNFVRLGVQQPARNQTEAWVAYDAQNLYVAIRAHDADMKDLSAKVTQRDGKIFSDDVLEIFLDPGQDRSHYFQFAFNPLGTQFDLQGDAAGADADWNGQWSVKTSRADDGWTAEVLIPFATLGLTKSVGKTWGLNVCRERAADGEDSCWSQTGAKFAVPAAFGTLTLPADFSPFLVDLGVSDWGRAIIGHNRVKFEVADEGATGRELSLQLEVLSPDENPRTTSLNLLTVAAGGKQAARLAYQFFQEGRHYLMLTATDRRDGRLVAAVGRTINVAALAEFSVYKSFYRDTVTVRYSLNVQPEEQAHYRLTAALHLLGGPPVATKEIKSLTPGSGQIEMDTSKLARGAYQIDMTLYGPDGQPALRKGLRFPVLRDKSVTSPLVTVRADNMLVVNGKPFFPIGIYESPSSEAYLRRLAEAGFNLCRMGPAPGDSMKRLLDKANSYGMKLWCPVGGDLDFSSDETVKQQRLAELVERAGRNPALLCWESMDEPAWGGQNADGLYHGYCYLRALDQQRPIWTNHAPRNLITTLAYYNRATDIAGCDIYPVPEPQTHSNLPDKTISVVGGETDKNIAAVDGQKPIFMVLQGFGWGQLSKQPAARAKAVMPTFAQSRFMAYDAIVHGANGLLYWGTHYLKKPSRFWSELRELVSELAAMQHVFTAHTCTGPDCATVTAPAAGVRLLHKRYQGKNFIIMVNETPHAVTATLHAPSVYALKLRRLFEDTTVPLEPGQVAQVPLQPYGVAVLSDDNSFADQRRDYSSEWQHPAPTTPPAALHEPGNLVANPGFEVDVDQDQIPDRWNPNVPLSAVITDKEFHSGKHSLAITSDGPGLIPLAVQRYLDTKGDTNYRLSGWVKTSNPDVECRLYVEWQLAGRFYAKALPWAKGTGKWQERSLEFKTTPDPHGGAYVVVQMRGKGTVYFDDIAVKEIGGK